MILDEIRMQHQAGRISLEPFTYSAIFPLATFLAATTLNVNVQINNDSWFLWRYTVFNALSAAGVLVAVPDVSITYIETGAGRNMMDQAQPLLTLAGTAQLPYILPEPKRLEAGSVLTVTGTNNLAAAMVLHMAFKGFKVFDVAKYTR